METRIHRKAKPPTDRRTDALAELGIRVVRFTNLEVMETFEGVCERIATVLRSAP
jgi:very-short-patch-repair endonuclease